MIFGDVVRSRRDASGVDGLAAHARGGARDDLSPADRLADFEFTQGDELQGLLAISASIPFRRGLRAGLHPDRRPMRWVVGGRRGRPGPRSGDRSGPARRSCRPASCWRRRRPGATASSVDSGDPPTDAAPRRHRAAARRAARRPDRSASGSIARLLLVDGLRRSEAAARWMSRGRRSRSPPIGPTSARSAGSPARSEPLFARGIGARSTAGPSAARLTRCRADPILSSPGSSSPTSSPTSSSRRTESSQRRTRRAAGRGGAVLVHGAASPLPHAGRLAFGIAGSGSLAVDRVAHVLIDRVEGPRDPTGGAAGPRRGRTPPRGPPPAAGSRPGLDAAARRLFRRRPGRPPRDHRPRLGRVLAGQAPTAEWSTAIGQLLAGRDLGAFQSRRPRVRRHRVAADRQRPGRGAVRRDARPADRGGDGRGRCPPTPVSRPGHAASAWPVTDPQRSSACAVGRSGSARSPAASWRSPPTWLEPPTAEASRSGSRRRRRRRSARRSASSSGS